MNGSESNRNPNGLIEFRLRSIEDMMARHGAALELLNVKVTELVARQVAPGGAPVCQLHERDLETVRQNVKQLDEAYRQLDRTQRAHDRILYAISVLTAALVLVTNIFGPNIRAIFGLSASPRVEYR